MKTHDRLTAMELREENARLRAQIAKLAEALREIKMGRGAYSRDPLTHAENCLEHAAQLATSALAEQEQAK